MFILYCIKKNIIFKWEKIMVMVHVYSSFLALLITQSSLNYKLAHFDSQTAGVRDPTTTFQSLDDHSTSRAIAGPIMMEV